MRRVIAQCKLGGVVGNKDRIVQPTPVKIFLPTEIVPEAAVLASRDLCWKQLDAYADSRIIWFPPTHECSLLTTLSGDAKLAVFTLDFAVERKYRLCYSRRAEESKDVRKCMRINPPRGVSPIGGQNYVAFRTPYSRAQVNCDRLECKRMAQDMAAP